MSTTPLAEIEVVFLIADLCGYTALTEAHGGGHAATVVRRYVELAGAALPPTARLVERVGDELLIAGGDVAAMVLTAIRLRDAVESEPLFPTLRAGLNAGRVLEQDGRYFGTPLNLTARVASYARPGQILCTDRIVASGRRLEGVDYRPLSRVRLKNISGLVELYEVVAGSAADETMSVDPVCRMRVPREAPAAHVQFGGSIWYFCSFECLKAFVQRPEDYAVMVDPAP